MKGLLPRGGAGALVGSVLAALAWGPNSARAEDPAAASDWTFSIAPYLWLAGISGTVTGPLGNSATASASIGDVLSHLEGGLMLLGEVRYKERWGIFADFDYARLDASGEGFSPVLGQPSVGMREYLGTMTGEYRFIDTDSFKIDGMAGFRVMSINSSLSFSGGLLPPRSDNGVATWVDPLVGIKGRYDFGTSGIFANAYGDLGGGPNGDLTWQLYGGLGYSFNQTIAAFAGYRYLSMQHQVGNLNYNIDQQGPLIGVDFRF